MTGRRYHLACVVLLGLLAVQAQAADAPVWLRDLDAGKADAKVAGKDVFLLFTGVGWCQPCMDFDRKVLKQPAFMGQVRKSYTLVEFDHTFGDTPAEKDRQARFAVLEKQYLVNAFPTLVLADAAGMPYAVMTGYESEVPAMLEWIGKARTARDLRDREFQAAAEGAERATHLHNGIQAVAGLLGTLDERHDDPVLVYYKDQVAEITRLDAGGAGKAYDDRRAARDRWLSDRTLIARLEKFGEASDWKGAIAYLDDTLKSTTDQASRFRLVRMRAGYLERESRYEEALRVWRDMLSRPGLSGDEQYQMHFREAHCLMKLGRVEEGIEVWDRCIAAADTPEKKVRRLDWKAQSIPIKTHHDLKMAAWRACRAEAPRGSDQWTTATYFLADDARKAGRPREALTLFQEELAVDPSGWTMTHVAECHVDLGDPGRAREWLDRAEAEIAKLKASPRQGDQQLAARVEKRITELRERLKAK
jgi:tetratricopeptide (TPR) repeat protein